MGFSYDPGSGRLSGVDSQFNNGEEALAFNYADWNGSDVPGTVSASRLVGGQWRPAVSSSRALEPLRDLVSAVSNVWDGVPVSA